MGDSCEEGGSDVKEGLKNEWGALIWSGISDVMGASFVKLFLGACFFSLAYFWNMWCVPLAEKFEDLWSRPEQFIWM